MRKQFSPNNQKFSVYSASESALGHGIDVYKALKNKDFDVSKTHMHVANSQSPVSAIGANLDFVSWLPFAAKSYNISPNVEDYILQPFIIMPSDLSNRNGVAFPLKELVKWNPQTGCQGYKTWKGKPAFYEHNNTDHTKAYGVIIDTALRKMEGYGQGKVWKVLELLAIDRTRHPETASRLISGDLNSASMGAYVGGYTCSICGAELGKCTHLHPREQFDFYPVGDQLCFRNIVSPEGFETSLVEVPAYVSAISDYNFKY